MAIPQSAQQEPSMEEILASIRRIISDEKAPEEQPLKKAEPKVVVDESPKPVVQPPAPPSPPPPSFSPPPPLRQEPEPEDVELEMADVDAPLTLNTVVDDSPIMQPSVMSSPIGTNDSSLMSESAARAAAGSLEELANQLKQNFTPPPSMPSFPVSAIGDGSRTLEGLVVEIMRPMLRAWIDENLPRLVTSLVQKEIEKVVRRVKLDN